jgi:hypothetical protein
MKQLEVPEFVAQDFSTGERHPSTAPDAVDRHIARVYLLISEALAGMPRAIGYEWEIAGERYGSGQPADEPYVLERSRTMYLIYSLERGRPKTIALFPKLSQGAKYFVWLVSKGQRSIDWSRHLEMER